MKITLDISKLVEEGKLTPAEAERLKTLASHDTGSLGINILLGFGVVAVAAGAGALVPGPAEPLLRNHAWSPSIPAAQATSLHSIANRATRSLRYRP